MTLRHISRRWKLGGAALAAAVIAGLLPGASAGATVETAGSDAASPTRSAAVRHVTLVTGDRVTLTGAGAGKLAITRGAGRAKVTFVTQRAAGQLLLIPSDAVSLINAGRLDRRLFDVNMLLKFGYDDRRKDVPLIVTYPDAAKARAGGAPTGARVTRKLPSARGQAMRVNKKDAGAFWRGLTAGSAAPKTLTAGASKVWLDGIRQPSLDESVPQIGAPDAWQAGFTGTGVKVAVLDTGIDATHPDLSDRVLDQQNFTEDPDDRDVVGHGTHVASTVAGSGAASNGRYKGVATGAKLLDGKVCEIFGCTESAILAGMEWGAQNAKVINMSLGGFDTPEIDPLEEAVNTLTDQYGTLFVIAAGNSGPRAGTVGSPGSADAALTVGAVTKTDQMADFSSRGPRTGDSAIKPDITAPGVDITAARGKDGVFGNAGESYVALNGTSMATPHTAGAAAILRQQHPTWTPEQLKAALMASAKPIADAGVFDQGAGRVDLTRAITQRIISTPASVSFGRQEWPHGDDTPVTKSVSYHNFGTSPVTLKLAVSATGPGGTPAPAGMFSLSAPTLTVPAGGDASVTITAKTSTPSPDGTYGGYVTATAGAQTVRTPFAVDKEVESYDVTLTHKNRAGRLTGEYYSFFFTVEVGFIDAYDPDGTVTIRLPKGKYLLESAVFGTDPDVAEISQLVRPEIGVTKDQSITVDARAAKPVTVTVPKPSVTQLLLDVGYVFYDGDSSLASDVLSDGTGVHTAHLGSALPAARFSAHVSSQWSDDEGRVVYNLFWYQKGRYFTGFRRDVVQYDLATVRADHAMHAAGAEGFKYSFGYPPGTFDGGWAAAAPFKLPLRRTEYYNTDGGVEWTSSFEEAVPSETDPFPQTVSYVESPRTVFKRGQVVDQQWNRGVFGPAFPAPPFAGLWATRTGNDIYVDLPMYSDGAGRAGNSVVDTGSTTLFRNGKKVGTSPYAGYGGFTVPAGDAAYRLKVVAERGAPFSLSTRTTCTWTFRSRRVAGEAPKALPLSAVRFAPSLDAYNNAPAGKKFTVPVTVQRHLGTPAATVESLVVKVSYDDGASWKPVKLVKSGAGWTTELNHPNSNGFVSFQATATDSAGNTVQQTIIRGYRIAK